jgi:hypothetical protein
VIAAGDTLLLVHRGRHWYRQGCSMLRSNYDMAVKAMHSSHCKATCWCNTCSICDGKIDMAEYAAGIHESEHVRASNVRVTSHMWNRYCYRW